jgi:hypothetical protein
MKTKKDPRIAFIKLVYSKMQLEVDEIINYWKETQNADGDWTDIGCFFDLQRTIGFHDLNNAEKASLNAAANALRALKSVIQKFPKSLRDLIFERKMELYSGNFEGWGDFS